MLTFLLIGINLAVSFVAFPRLQIPAKAESFFFAPAYVAAGRNRTGMLLSHFAHADIGHLLFNMITLYFFAPIVERGLGPLSLLLIYVVAGVSSNIALLILHRGNPDYRAIGASDSVTAMIFAAIVLAPGMSIYLFLIPLPIPAPLFAVGYIGLSTYMMGRQAGNICHEAHIAGALTGLIMAGLMSPAGFDPLLGRLTDFIPG